MNQNIEKFIELLKTDEALQKKIKDAGANYTGEKTPEALFRNLVFPAAEEAGVPFTFEEYEEYTKQYSEEIQNLDLDEMNQVAGGDTIGAGINLCYGVGIGLGYTERTCSRRGVGDMLCIGFGAGAMAPNVCFTAGVEA